MSDNGDDVVQSLEFRFLVDRAIAASRSGHPATTDLFVRAAERLLTASLPYAARDISLIASRKVAGAAAALSLVKRLTPMQAAAVALIWILRGARKPALQGLAEAFRGDEAFGHALRRLCPRVGL